MTPQGVRNALVEDDRSVKELRLNDGTQLTVRNREQWLAAVHALIVLDEEGYVHHVAYRNIASVRIAPPNGRSRKRKRK